MQTETEVPFPLPGRPAKLALLCACAQRKTAGQTEKQTSLFFRLTCGFPYARNLSWRLSNYRRKLFGFASKPVRQLASLQLSSPGRKRVPFAHKIAWAARAAHAGGNNPSFLLHGPLARPMQEDRRIISRWFRRTACRTPRCPPQRCRPGGCRRGCRRSLHPQPPGRG